MSGALSTRRSNLSMKPHTEEYPVGIDAIQLIVPRFTVLAFSLDII